MEPGFWTAVLLVLNLILIVAVLRQRKRRKGEPPIVVHRYPFVGGALEFGRDPVGYLTDLKKKHGDVFTINLAGWKVHFFTNPMDVKYLEKNKLLKHGEVLYDFATRVVGLPHAIDLSGQHTPRGPKVMQTITKTMRGSGSLSSLTESCLSVTTYAFEEALRWEPGFVKGQPIGLYELCSRLVFDTTFYMFFGYHESTARRKAEKESFYEDFMYYFEKSALLVDRVSVNLLPKVKRVRNRLLKAMANLNFSERIGVSELILSIAKLGEGRPDERARHLLIILWSAQANNRPALFWTIFHLLKNPDATEKILEEYDDVLDTKKGRHNAKTLEQPGRSLSRDWLGMTDVLSTERTDLDKLVVLDACIRESLRLVGSSMVVRKAEEAGTVVVASGLRYRIREGDFTAYFSPLTHMDDVLHERPHQYEYGRHLVEHDHSSDNADDMSETSSTCSSASSIDSFSDSKIKARSHYGTKDYRVSSSRALLTFGYGANRCPGRHIALIEIKIAILVLFRYFSIKLNDRNQTQPPFNMMHLGFGVMPPADDVMVKIAPKENRSVPLTQDAITPLGCAQHFH